MKIRTLSLLVLLTLCAFGPRPAYAEGSIVDQLYAGFVGRAKLAIESTTDGTVQPEFLVNYVEIGKVKGEFIAAIDAGALGEVLPESGQVDSVQWTTGGKLHLAPLIKNFVNLPEEWEFLGNIELDARASYNWSGHHPTYGIVAAYPFK